QRFLRFRSVPPATRIRGGLPFKQMTTRIRPFLVAFLIVLSSVVLVPAAIAQIADLRVTKTGPDQAAAGADISYTIHVFNDGPDNSLTATLKDKVPDGTSFVSVAAPAGWSCGNPDQNNDIVCTKSSIPVGADDVFTFVFNINPNTPGGTVITNGVSISTPPIVIDGDIFPSDPNEENNTAFAITTVPGGTSVNLGVTKTVDAEQAVADSNVTYTIQVVNGGPANATDAQLSDTLPGDMTFVSLTPNSGPTWSCSTPPATMGETIVCTNNNLPAGSTSVFTLVGHIPSGKSPGTEYTNVATVSSSMDETPENNTSAATTTVVSAAPALTTAASGSVVLGGSIWDTGTLSGGNNPTGTIVFAAYGPDDATCTTTPVFVSEVNVIGNGQYTSATFVPAHAGVYRWVASYTGDFDNKAVTTACGDPNESVTVAKANTTTTVASSMNPSVGGQPVTFTATVTPNTSTPTTPSGTVQFVVDGANFGAPVAMSNGMAEISTSSLSAGNHSVTAQYSGDANFSDSEGTLDGGQTVTPGPSPTPTPTPTPSPTPTATPTPTPAQALNISTRLRVDIGDRVMIGGFIITGNASKPIVVRGLGPSLANSNVPASTVLNDPFLQLRGPDGALITGNDNWKDSSQRSQIEGTVYEPTDDREAVVLATLAPGAYTAIISGVDQTAGVGLVEVYDNGQAVDSQLANISTRGFVLTADNVMIGGFTLGGTSNPTRIAVRALGPSLTSSGLSNVLADPTLELYNANGTVMVSNDDWQSDPASAAQLTANGLALPNPKESGIFTSLAPPGQFTAIVAGKDGTIGIALVEIYNLK
ncbi:MAG TPA: Ig-like domain repeat protein, partial [Chthoniobacterales bacterium]|nr:Ig-like domain repeat protein [Chthoniobacterales bacterium]